MALGEYEDAAKKGRLEVAEIYRDVSILRREKGKKVSFQVDDDLAGDVVRRDNMDNGDLEDLLRPVACKAKMKISWDSEADTLVAKARDLETCRWLIDRVYDLRDVHGTHSAK